MHILTKDLTVTMPIRSEKEAKFADPEIPGVIDMGSPYDEGSSDAPQEPQGEPVEVIPDSEQPPTVIEIAQYEEGMEDVLIG